MAKTILEGFSSQFCVPNIASILTFMEHRREIVLDKLKSKTRTVNNLFVDSRLEKMVTIFYSLDWRNGYYYTCEEKQPGFKGM